MSEFHCWLDPIIEEQAKAYGLSRDKFEVLMGSAAAHQQVIDEPSNQNEMLTLQSRDKADSISK